MQPNRSPQELNSDGDLLINRISGVDDPYLIAHLDLQQDNIRLVELLPSSDEDYIRCDMRSFALNATCPAYVALSYRWDHETPKDTIVLNGTVKSVGHNLWAFLNQMRLRGIFETFWIDALCINQADTKERNHQVQMMKNIYSRADSVSIWLGDSEPDSELHKAIVFLKIWGHPAYKFPTSPFLDPFFYADRLSLLRPLCDHEYWRRMWIIQEVFHARQATLYCGSSDASLSTFEKVVEEAQMPSEREPRSPRMNSNLRTPAAELLELRSMGKPASLISLLIKFRNHEATEVRDKVYALHGMCEEASQMTVDYSIAREELFAQVIKWTKVPSGDTQFGRMVAQMLGVE